MTPEEKFLFDLQGYLVIKNVLNADEVAALNALADAKFPPVPGTHKSNFIESILSDVIRFERPAPYVVQPAAEH